MTQSPVTEDPFSDIAIARRATLKPVVELAQSRLGIAVEHVLPFGHHRAKLSLPFVNSLEGRPEGKLILVTAISPTPAGEGKTTTTVGLGDALNHIGKKALIALREPSLGPVFGLKGGATGGGRAQVVPMEDINLHFNGDFHAVAAAHNLLAATLDNHIHHGNALDIDTRRIALKRVMDMNDRALRHITVGLGGPGNGFVREDGFDIVVASEVMAILCLATSVADLKQRLARIVVAETRGRKPVTAADLKVHGAMAVLLKDALAPNLVQTLGHNLALLHGGPLHLFFNMLGLWMFGSELERLWGGRRYAQFLLAGVLAAAFTQLLTTALTGSTTPTVGASGGLFALLLAFGMLFPNRIIMPLFPPIPMKARTFVVVFGALELVLGLYDRGGVAHFAHLGGMVGGFLMIRYWRGQPPFGRRR